MSSNDSTSTHTGPSEQLRDARLVRALEHAPDVQEAAQPTAALRESILRAAHDAVTAAPAGPIPAPWWSRWTGWLRGNTSTGRMPWNAAFATVLLAGFITLLWRDEPIPSSRMDGPAPTVQQESAAPPPPAAVPAAPAEVPAQNRGREAKKAAQDSVAGVAPPMAHGSAVATAPAMPSPPPPPAPAAAPAREEAPAPAVPGMATAESAAVAKQQERARAPAALAVAPRAPAATPALPVDWTHVRRVDAAAEQEGIPRAAAGDLSQLLDALKTGGETDTSVRDGVFPTAVARVALLREGSVLGVLELSGSRWRFLPEAGSGLAAHQGVLSDAQARALLAALQRVAP